MSADVVEWDSLVYGIPVSQIGVFRVGNARQAAAEYQAFEKWIYEEKIGIVSCRLAHDRLIESMFLEARGFRFVEMVLHPTLEVLQERDFGSAGLNVERATSADIAVLQNIAATAFGFERFHVDPRLDRRLADERYGRWVVSSLGHPKQDLYKIQDGQRLVGFFLIEIGSDSSAYWHLTAIAPDWQGQGYGRRVWTAMLAHCKSLGCGSVLTTISARNTPVLNLYSQLQFRFKPPEMTFHWIRGFE
ncbi:MAG: GNAT family N-acetyltransferase [Desulfuromonadales bacterium]|nr:GNAT family N-acetyltransferase [Desulfuromonadales bacterium]